jgi:NosR/NirI family transcriptional regulator, nitrous oxide reductase regulator
VIGSRARGLGARVVIGVLCFLVLRISIAAGAYQAALPEQLASSPALCELVPCAEVFPGAAAFSERKGRPFYVEALGPEGELLGYVMLSTDITDIPAYSGKPVVSLIGMDRQGRFVGVKVLKHSEPILLLGIPERALLDFNAQYLGKSVRDRIEIGAASGAEGELAIDAISGATVTAIAQNQVVLSSASAVARQVGILDPIVRPQAVFETLGQRPDWAALVAEGSVSRLRVRPEQVGMLRSPQPFIELWMGYLNQSDVGRAVLGDAGYQQLMRRLGPGEHALFVIRTAGQESFKGSGFVRGGLYDRVQVRQGMDYFSFRDVDSLPLYEVRADGAPGFSESIIFIVRSEAFSAAFPWKFVFLGNRVDRDTGERSFVHFATDYWLPGKYLRGGRPALPRVDATWVRVWRMRAYEIVAFVLLLLVVAAAYASRDRLSRASKRKRKWPINVFKYSAWAASIGFIGFHLMAQPSITQVLTWFHALLSAWRWELFLSDPFIFLFWIFIIATVFVWGRGLFCGWLCPFGSLSEVLYKAAGKIGLKRWQSHLPQALHHRLKWIKYAVFFGLLAVSMFSISLAEMLAEVEPFKTTFLVGVFNRAWPYALFVAVLLGLSLFIERPFCKYLCPLGAALAMPSTFRWFGLKRKIECNTCKACAVGCGSLAIDQHGRIDRRECMLCLDCMVLYYDDHACPPLASERKRRVKAGQPLTAIGADGRFIPLTLIDAAPAAKALAPGQVDPRLPTPEIAAPYSSSFGVIGRLLGEAWDHLWPFSRAGFKRQLVLQAAGLALAATVTVTWVLAALGQLAPAAIIGWWLGWSVFEVLVRRVSKPYVKEGPWWGAVFRQADIMDLLSYVGFKNLLIGAGLFLALASLGVPNP